MQILAADARTLVPRRTSTTGPTRGLGWAAHGVSSGMSFLLKIAPSHGDLLDPHLITWFLE